MNTELVEPLHRAYCNLSGLQITLDMSRVFCWERWLAHGWCAADLGLAIEYLKKTSKGNLMPLRFAFFIGRPDKFEEVLSEARCAKSLAVKKARPKPQPTRAESLTDAGPHTEKRVSEVALGILRRFRMENGDTALQGVTDRHDASQQRHVKPA